LSTGRQRPTSRARPRASSASGPTPGRSSSMPAATHLPASAATDRHGQNQARGPAPGALAGDGRPGLEHPGHHKGYIERTILPTLGHLPLRRLDTATLDRFSRNCVAAAAWAADDGAGHRPPGSRDPAPGAGSGGPLGLDSGQPGGTGQPTPTRLGRDSSWLSCFRRLQVRWTATRGGGSPSCWWPARWSAATAVVRPRSLMWICGQVRENGQWS
jgi:hypothetical protein